MNNFFKKHFNVAKDNQTNNDTKYNVSNHTKEFKNNVAVDNKAENSSKQLDVVFLLDRSGSMGGSESDTIGGYNSYLAQQRKSNAKITTILFDNQYEKLVDRVDAKILRDLTEEDYFVRGSTALYDAIGTAICDMDKKKAEKVLFIITTDGLENASQKFNREQVKELIQGHTNWEFIYIGANIDSYAEGTSIGVKRSNIANYKKSREGIDKMFEAIGKAQVNMMECECVQANWKEELDEYISKNKE